MSLKDRSWVPRFDRMGDEAEHIFEQVYPQGKVKYGLSRPPVGLTKVPPFVRFTPDYLTAKGLVEVQGFGRDQVFKLKHDKYAALDEWNLQFRVDLFAWDTTNKRYGFIRLHDFMDAWEEHGFEDAFDGGKNPYMGLHASFLPVDQWVAYTPSATPEATPEGMTR